MATNLLSRSELEAITQIQDPEEREQAKQRLVDKYGMDVIQQSVEAIDAKIEAERPGFFARGAASFGGTPEREAQIYKSLGYDVEVRPEGLMAKTAEGERYVDPKRLDIGDIADVAGYIPPTLLGILGGIKGAALGAPAGPVTAAAGLAAGSGAGEAAGEAVRQNIGKAFGAEDVDLPAVAEAGVIGAISGPLSKPVETAVRRLAAPFKGAVSKRLNKSVIEAAEYIDEQLGTNLRGNLPLSAMTEHRGLQAVEQRVAEGPYTGDVYAERVSKPFESEQQRAFTGMEARTGPMRGFPPGGGVSMEQLGTIGRGEREAGERIIQATKETLEARKDQIDNAYKELGEVIDDGAIVDPTETRQALSRINEMTGSATEFELSAELRGQLAKIGRDVDKIETFEQMDNFRKLVGSLLQAHSDEFSRTGLDAQLSKLYGALLSDIETVYARDAGVLGLHLGESARGLAREGIELQNVGINRLLKGDKEEAIVDRLMSRAMTPKEVARFRQRIGSLPGASGLKTTEAAEIAWRATQAEVLEKLREASIREGEWNKPLEAALSGSRMLSEIKRMGGYDKLKAIFGPEKADELMRFAGFLKESNVRERFMNTSGTSAANQFIATMFELVRRPSAAIGQWLGMHGMARMMTTRRGREYLTEGFPRAENILGQVGRVGTRYGVREYRGEE